jgi:dTDP-4-dehydrorhamnose 3,5-epimerase
MQLTKHKIPEIVELIPKRHGDERGYFSEIFRDDWFRSNVADVAFAQENQSLSEAPGTLRGLHFQTAPFAQGKLVRCLAGALFDVAVDIRKGSPSFGQWTAAELSADNCHQLWVPAGFAHGFCTLTPNAVICYKVTAVYSPECDKGMAWNDAAVGIDWPQNANPSTLSAKDKVQPELNALPTHFTYSSKAGI